MEQANVQLSISSEATEAVRGLAKLEQAEKSLETAVKVGNRTLKGRVDTEQGLAAVLNKVEGIERKAATAVQRRAAASLAAQKSAALLAEMTKKQAREARMAEGFEKALAKAQFQADAANQARLRKRVEESTKATQLQKGAFLSGAKSALNYGAAIVGLGSAAAVATSAIRTLVAVNEHWKEVGDRQNQQGAGLKEFVALQKPGEAGQQHVKETLKRGAAAGLTPEQVAAIAQPIQSVVDENGDGALDENEKAKFTEDTGAAFRLAQMGISAEDAQTVITSGRSRGMGGATAADKLTAASDLSAAGPADFARAASALGQFQDYDTGLAAATALTKEEKNFEQIPTLLRGAALTLGSANDDSDFSKKFGLAGLSESEKIQRLRELGAQQGEGATEEERIASFSRGFKNYGLDEEKARALGILVRQGETVTSTRERLQNVQPGLTEEKVAALAANPLTAGTLAADQAKATAAINNLYGNESERGKAANQRALERGAELQRGGLSIGVDKESGQALPWTDPRRIIAEAMGMVTGAGSFRGEKDGGEEGLKEALGNLQQSLDRNTAATEANSGATKKNIPVGGSPANAEEKY